VNIISIQSFPGKNIYSYKPVIKILIDIGKFHDIPTKDITGFNERLLEMFPNLRKHRCSRGYEGGFVERMDEGTYVPHVIEHLALDMQNTAGYDVSFGRARVVNEPSLYGIVFEYMNERCGIESVRAAAAVVKSLAENLEMDADSILENLKKVAVESEPGPSTGAILGEAKRRGIPVLRLGDESLMQLGYGKYSRLIQASLTDKPSCISVDIASNKYLTKRILSDNDIPVPYGDIAYTRESAVTIAREVGYPVVIKPYDGNQGKGVALDLNSEEQVKSAYDEAVKLSKAVVVEKFIKGRDYRVLVVGDKVSAVSERKPPSVIGDGIHSVKELIEIENSNLLRGDDHERPLTKIKLDNTLKQVLKRRGLDESHIPALNEVVSLRDNGNLSTGGTARDCTMEIHPYNSMLAVRAAKAIGLDIAGIDITAEDISVPINHNNGAVIEVNAAPGLRMHLYPTEGQTNNVAADIIDMMFPAGKPYSIPIVSVTGTNGKTTTTRIIKHILSMMGIKVGMTSTSGIFIGDKCILKGDNTGPASARMVLSNKEVEAAVLETARGGIIRKGLGYDQADVGIVTNISEDHLGLEDINTLEDLAYVKSLVVEAVKPDGYAVLNADDKMTDYFIGRVKSKIILCSKSRNNPLVIRHIRDGGKAVFVDNGIICMNEREKILSIVKVDDIPITYGGMLECNIENSLAAAAALLALNVPVGIIKMGLMLFKPDQNLNPGRFNIFDMGDFKVMLDYGHNPAGYSEAIKFITRMNASRNVGIIGMPGDRLERNFREVGKMCSRVFSRIYIKEDEDLRGRKPGEVAGIFYEAVLENGMREENIEIIYPELKALEKAMLDAQPGDIIVMFYEKFEPAFELISRFRQEMERSIIQPEAVVEIM